VTAARTVVHGFKATCAREAGLVSPMRFLVYLLPVILIAGASAQTPAPRSPPPKPATAPAAPGEELFELGRQLFEQYAPPEIKAEYEFPSKERWDEFAVRLQRGLQGDSLQELAVYLPEARLALPALRTFPGYEEYADWLEQRIDEIEVARQVTTLVAPPPPGPGPTPPGPAPKSPPSKLGAGALPHYDLWVTRVRARPLPSRAAELMPRLRAAFVAEGVPPELAWLAEAESSLNPGARSPAGAKGLFQFMPETAQSLGLDTFLPDERADPEKSAHAAARYLRSLHGRFGNWPLALAAYNAGEGRVSRVLAARGAGAKDFASVAGALPAETRMYVPKVYALMALRTGIAPEKIPPPRS
jgi:membrane-bound lytic murein transglycosylase D